MSKNIKYNVALSIEDKASSGVKKAFAEMQKGETKMAQSHKRFADARKLLDVRSEKEIQREIKQTEAAYNRLSRAGFKGASDQQRAYQAMTNRVRELNAEMGKTSKLGSNLGNLTKIGGGLLAGGTIAINRAKEPVMKYMDYQQRLAYTANTAFDDRDAEGRIQGIEELDTLVRSTVQYGGTKEDAIAGINALLAPGELGFNQVENLAPIIQKTAVATQSSTEEISKIVMAMLTNFDIAISEIPLALDMALKAGESGSFELQDMAGWLSQQLSMGAQRGMKGMDHYKDILVMNQQAARIAGSSNQAGNYVYSFLSAMTDASTIRAFENSAYKEGNKEGIDLIKSMNGMVAEGASPVEAFMEVMDAVIGSNKDYQKLLKAIDGAEGADKLAKLEQMATLLEGSEVSKILGNKQSLMGYIALRSQGEYGEQVAKALEDALGAVDISHQVVASTDKYKVEGASANSEFRQIDAYKPIAESYANLMVTLDEYAMQYPELTKNLIYAKEALITLGTAAFGIAALGKIFGNKLPAPGKPPIPGAVTSAGVGALAVRGGKVAVIAGLTAIQKSSSKEYNEILKQKDAEAQPILDQAYIEKGDEYLQAAYDKFGPFSIGTKWHQTEPNLMRGYLEKYDNYTALSEQYGEDEMQERWKAWRGMWGDLFNTKWYNQTPEELEEMLNDQNSVRNRVLEHGEYSYPQSINEMVNHPDYQPINIGDDIRNAIEQSVFNLRQQQQDIVDRQPTIIQLNVTGEVDGRGIMEIVETFQIDKMNRGSNT